MSYTGDIRLGRAIRRARAIRGLSQQAAAFAAGLKDRSLLGQWENSHRAIPLERWEKLTTALGIETNGLFAIKARGDARFIFAGPLAQAWLWVGNNKFDLLSSDGYGHPQPSIPGLRPQT